MIARVDGRLLALGDGGVTSALALDSTPPWGSGFFPSDRLELVGIPWMIPVARHAVETSSDRQAFAAIARLGLRGDRHLARALQV